MYKVCSASCSRPAVLVLVGILLPYEHVAYVFSMNFETGVHFSGGPKMIFSSSTQRYVVPGIILGVFLGRFTRIVTQKGRKKEELWEGAKKWYSCSH